MIDIALAVLVLGAVTLALALDVARRLGMQDQFMPAARIDRNMRMNSACCGKCFASIAARSS